MNVFPGFCRRHYARPAVTLRLMRRCNNQRVSIEEVISSDPEVQGGAVVFSGTRVPLKNLIDYLEAGDSLELFLEHFPSVKREQAIAALDLAQQALVTLAGTH